LEGDGTELSGNTLGGGTEGIGSPNHDGTRITGGDAILRNALEAASDDDKNFIRNLAEHELTHVLGLSDDGKGSVTKSGQPETARSFNDQDTKELNSLYGTANSGGTKAPQGEVTPQGGGPLDGFFDYQLDFVPGNALVDPDDPEHVALFVFDIDPSLVSAIDLPPGWIGLIPQGPVEQSDPFFAESMVDTGISPSPFGPGADPFSYIAMQVSLQESVLDGVAGIDPALSLDTPSLAVRIHTVPEVIRGEIAVWAGGELQTVLGPVRVPAPPTAVLVALGLLAGRRWGRTHPGC